MISRVEVTAARKMLSHIYDSRRVRSSRPPLQDIITASPLSTGIWVSMHMIVAGKRSYASGMLFHGKLKSCGTASIDSRRGLTPMRPAPALFLTVHGMPCLPQKRLTGKPCLRSGSAKVLRIWSHCLRTSAPVVGRGYEYSRSRRIAPIRISRVSPVRKFHN